MERHWDTASNHEQSALADEAVLALRQSFCDYLVSARKQRSMSIHEIAGVTRIPVRSLERLESGLFEELPADVFVRGFLRSYARCVGLDVEETIRRYTACGMTPAPVASPMADELASSMATLHEGGHPSVRQVTAPLPSQALSDDGIGTSPGLQAQPAGRAGRSPTGAVVGATIEAATNARRALPATPVAADGRVQQHDQEPGAGAVLAQASAPILVSPSASSAHEQPVDERPARRKRRRRRRQHREVADAASTVASGVASGVVSGVASGVVSGGASGVASGVAAGVASVVASGAPEARRADAEAVSASSAESAPSEAPLGSVDALVGGPAGEAAADARDESSMAATGVVASEAPPLRAETVSDRATQLGRATTAAEQVAVRPFSSLPRASTQSARTQPVGRGRAATVTARPVLVIDDAHPEEAERAQQERVERSDSSWRSLLPPALLDSDDGSHRGTLTLAVIILVIVATLTMSYLLRRPNVSGDGVTWNATTALDEHRLG